MIGTGKTSASHDCFVPEFYVVPRLAIFNQFSTEALGRPHYFNLVKANDPTIWQGVE